MGHAVIDLPAEFHSTTLHESQLLEPSFAVRQFDRDMVDRRRRTVHAPTLGRLGRQLRIFDERNVVVAPAALVVAAVELHCRLLLPLVADARIQLTDQFETDDFRPKAVRLLHVVNVHHEMVHASWCNCDGRNRDVFLVAHVGSPRCGMGIAQVVDSQRQRTGEKLAGITMMLSWRWIDASAGSFGGHTPRFTDSSRMRMRSAASL